MAAVPGRSGVLPTEKSPRRTGLQDLSVLLYGPSKVGKSTFCSQADGALFLATEPGLNSLDVFQVSVTSWQVFLDACVAIERGDDPFKTIVIDTVDCLYRLIVDHVRAKLGIVHESDLGFGKAYGLINGEFHRARQVELAAAVAVGAGKTEIRRCRRMKHRDLGRGKKARAVAEVEFDLQRLQARKARAYRRRREATAPMPFPHGVAGRSRRRVGLQEVAHGHL